MFCFFVLFFIIFLIHQEHLQRRPVPEIFLPSSKYFLKLDLWQLIIHLDLKQHWDNPFYLSFMNNNLGTMFYFFLYSPYQAIIQIIILNILLKQSPCICQTKSNNPGCGSSFYSCSLHTLCYELPFCFQQLYFYSLLMISKELLKTVFELKTADNLPHSSAAIYCNYATVNSQ